MTFLTLMVGEALPARRTALYVDFLTADDRGRCWHMMRVRALR
jgi:hypothetical protein